MELAAREFTGRYVAGLAKCTENDGNLSKYIEFHALDEDFVLPGEKQPSPDNLEQIYGHVYFDANTGCNLAPFVPPKLAGLDEYTFKRFHGENKLLVRFKSNDYLILIVPQRLILEGQPPLLRIHSGSWAFALIVIRRRRKERPKESDRRLHM